MINHLTQARKTGMQGFSWTTFFFGPFPALFRGHISAALIMTLVAFVTVGISWLVFPFFYNGWHWNVLTAKGFVPLNVAPVGFAMPSVQIVNNLGTSSVSN